MGRRVAYLDCFSGISGDMLLGALLDVGVSLEGLRRELAKLPLEGYSLDAERVDRAGLSALQATVEVRVPQEPRNLADVTAIIEGSSLPEPDRERSVAVFRRLAEA